MMIESLSEPGSIDYHFTSVVGPSLGDAHVLGARSEPLPRFDMDEGEYFVARVEGGKITDVATARVPLYTLCRVPSGRVYVAAFSRRSGIWRSTPGSQLQWERMESPPMQGLFALDEDHVVAWSPDGVAQSFYLLRGTELRQIPAPPGRVTAMHGCAPDWIVAVGHKGLVTRWDGRAWRTWHTGADGAFGAVHVCTPDEMYATGPLGQVFEGGSHGWAMRAPVEGVATSIVKALDRVLVADLVGGLLELAGTWLEPRGLPVRPRKLYGGNASLLLTEKRGVAETNDLTRVTRLVREDFEAAFEEIPPSWW